MEKPLVGAAASWHLRRPDWEDCMVVGATEVHIVIFGPCTFVFDPSLIHRHCYLLAHAPPASIFILYHMLLLLGAHQFFILLFHSFTLPTRSSKIQILLCTGDLGTIVHVGSVLGICLVVYCCFGYNLVVSG